MTTNTFFFRCIQYCIEFGIDLRNKRFCSIQPCINCLSSTSARVRFAVSPVTLKVLYTPSVKRMRMIFIAMYRTCLGFILLRSRLRISLIAIMYGVTLLILNTHSYKNRHYFPNDPCKTMELKIDLLE